MAVGRSDATSYKQSCLSDLVYENLIKCQHIFNKHNWIKDKTYYIIDFTAGDMDPEYETSPRIFLDTLKNIIPFRFKGVFVEKNKKTFDLLEENMVKYCKQENRETQVFLSSTIHLYNQKMQNVLDTNIKNKWKYGIAYFDPNGFGGSEELEFLSNFTKSWNAIDLIMNISPTSVKRCYHINKDGWNMPRNNLTDIINMMDKKYWWIRPPKNDNDPWKWVMLFGTNMKGYNIERLDFHQIDSEAGSQLLEIYDNYIETKKGEKNAQ